MTASRNIGSIWPAWEQDKRTVLVEAFYWLGIPTGIGLIVGWYAVGGIDLETKFAILGFWCTFMIATWWTQICGAWCAYGVLRPWQPSPWVVWITGPIVFSLVGLVPQNALLEWANTNLPDGAVDFRPIRLRSAETPDFWIAYFSAAIPGTAFFVAVNFVYERILGIPRFRYTNGSGNLRLSPARQSGDETSPPEPQFMQRVSPQIREGSLVSVSAQEHYISVTTTAGKELIRYSFSDALRDLKPYRGLRTHRSHWVAKDRIRELGRIGSSYQVTLDNGTRVPVSRTYLVSVRQQIGS